MQTSTTEIDISQNLYLSFITRLSLATRNLLTITINWNALRFVTVAVSWETKTASKYVQRPWISNTAQLWR